MTNGVVSSVTRHRITVVLARCAIALLALAAPGSVALAQRGLPSSPFGVGDLKKIHWIEGRWRGSAQGQAPFFEQYRFANDSTLEITYFADSSFTNTSGRGRVYLTVGRIYHATGPSLWGASKVDTAGIFFVPQKNASNTVSWSFQSPDLWTATLRSSATGHEQVTIYQMRRIK
jgi:hypothetical protein